MKKKISMTTIAALALLSMALTPVMAAPASDNTEVKVPSPGFYEVGNKKYYSIKDFKKLTKDQKKNLFKGKTYIVTDQAGTTFSGMDLLTLTSQQLEIAKKSYNEIENINWNDFGSGEVESHPRAPYVNPSFILDDREASENSGMSIPLDSLFVGENLQYSVEVKNDAQLLYEVTGTYLSIYESKSIGTSTFTIKAKNEFGESKREFDYSVYASVGMTTAVKKNEGIEVSWNGSKFNKVTGYQVFRGESDDIGQAEVISDILPVDIKSFVDTSESNNLYYFVRPVMNQEVEKRGAFTSVKISSKLKAELAFSSLFSFVQSETPSSFNLPFVQKNIDTAELEANNAINSGWSESEVNQFDHYKNLALAKKKIVSISHLDVSQIKAFYVYVQDDQFIDIEVSGLANGTILRVYDTSFPDFNSPNEPLHSVVATGGKASIRVKHDMSSFKEFYVSSVEKDKYESARVYVSPQYGE